MAIILYLVACIMKADVIISIHVYTHVCVIVSINVQNVLLACPRSPHSVSMCALRVRETRT